jgi:glycosyltransferase involved in cell wall biosynthesis
MPMSIIPKHFDTTSAKILFWIRLIIQLIFFLPNEFALLFFVVINYRKSVVFYHGGGNLIQGFLCARLTQIPLLIHVREFIEEDQNWAYLCETVEKSYYRYAVVSFCVSNAVTEKFRNKYPHGHFRTIYNAVHQTPSNSDKHARGHQLFSNQTTQIVLVGNIASHKGQFQAVKAINQLLTNHRKVHLTLVGRVPTPPDPYSEAIQSYIADRGLAPYISLAGYQENTDSFYLQADIALVCSRCEAFGRVTIEAASLGCVVVGSDTGGTPEILSAFGGVQYQYGNIDDLATKINAIIDSKSAFISEQESTIVKARSAFTIEKMQEQIESAFKEFISS